MTDQSMSVGKLVAVSLWVLAVVVMTTGTVLGSLVVCMWAALLVGGANVATVRHYFVHQDSALRDAYRIGRDVRDVHQIPTQRN